MVIRNAMRSGLITAGCLLLTSCGVTKEIHRTFPLAGDGRVVLDQATGGAVIRAWDYEEIKVDAVAKARNGTLLQEAEVRFDTSPSSIRLWTEYLEPESGSNRPNLPLAQNRAAVHYDLTVPRNASLDRIAVENNTLSIEDVRGNIRATVRQGTLRARFTKIARNRVLVFETQGGDIDLTLPRNPDIRLDATARNGSIDTSLGIPLRNALPGGSIVSKLEGIFGNGSTSIKLNAINGDIRIRTP